ncbi:putative drug exporter of the RND superfamily [Nocardia amikacinitolerans]|uniref:Putative drug exporter of the RND superfamily n=1 Tax=Nocardia amikacinitolerans TaxID=756689 RepID=A0A285LTJ3_9NOCA|nr:MMPL family transporter [Nocardia amikacinitolerans]SNY86986.1 putative drug exporter of the RND superfamily [Nocardia amikacinitolerans]
MGTKSRAWLLIGLWIAVLAALTPWAGGLDDVKSDREIDYLPASAQSTMAAELETTLPGGTENVFLVVYHRAGGVTEADRATAAAHYTALRTKYEAQGGPDQPLPSDDGAALMFPVAVGESYGESAEYIEQFRAMVAEHSEGLTVQVAGPGALQADFEGAFEGIDERLLLVTALVVTVILLLTYRSPVLWLVPLIAVAGANVLSMAAVYGLAKTFDITVNDQSAAILTILVFGVGTDYALLIVARYREELHHRTDVGAAMSAALRNSVPAIAASAATVSLGLLCLLAADMNNAAGMGPVGAAGIVCTLAMMVTLFPALLVVCGRWIFWPRVPRVRTETTTAQTMWVRIGTTIARRPVVSALASVAVLALLSLGLLGNTASLGRAEQFVDTPESVRGQSLIAAHFPDRAGTPLLVLAPNGVRDAAMSAVTADPGIGAVEAGRSGPTVGEIVAIPRDPADSTAEYATIERLRDTLGEVAPGTVVGGPSAANRDIATASARDRRVVIPLVLLVVTAVLGLLLRSLAAPVGLVLTVVLSFGSALGASVFAFEQLFGFDGLDSGLVLLAFLFLVALGVDYNIFLVSRAREEAVRHGTSQGILRSLAVTGGVITSAGIVLAATFAVLVTLPLVSLAQLGFAVAFGVLLDTLLVRSVLVPALTLIAGDRVWWPSRMSRPAASSASLEPETVAAR